MLGVIIDMYLFVENLDQKIKVQIRNKEQKKKRKYSYKKATMQVDTQHVATKNEECQNMRHKRHRDAVNERGCGKKPERMSNLSVAMEKMRGEMRAVRGRES